MRAGLFRSLVITLVSAMLMMSAHAYDGITRGGVQGNYLGIQFGSTQLKGKNQYLPDMDGDIQYVHPTGNGFGMRLIWGYQFIDYLAIEGAYSFWSPAVYNIPNGNSPETRYQAVIDILGKAILPIYKGFNIFAKAGPAIIDYKQAGLLAPSQMPGGNGGVQSITVRPEVGAGFGYAFSPNWTVDITLYRILGSGVIPTSTAYMFGLTYHAVDLYCGQFLC